MPYLPNKEVIDTHFTPAQASDLLTHLALLNERWERHFPKVVWKQLDFRPVPMTSGGESYVAGVDGKTIINPVYNEAIPQGPDDVDNPGIQFKSPHGTPVDATARKIYKPGVDINARITIRKPNQSLTLLNKSGRVDIRLTLLCSLLDRSGVVVNEGDVFVWRGVRYEVKEASIPEMGYWQGNTNIPLYVVCEAAIDQLGS